MKPLILFWLIILPVIGFSQVVDSATVVKEVDSLVLVCRTLTGQQKFKQALQVIEDAKGKAEAELGKMSAAYASCVHTQGRTYLIMGKYSDAEPYCIEAKDIRAKVLGKEHLDYAASLHNLATLYSYIGDYDKAEQLHLEVKEIRAKVLGRKHQDYAQSLNNLAIVYMGKGNYAKAESLYLESKKIYAKTVGTEHPDYTAPINGLAVLYQNKGDYAKAELMFFESKEIRAKTVGKEHPYYSSSLNNLAGLYVAKGDYSKAEPLYLEAVEILAKTLGKEHPNYAASLNNLAILYDHKGDYAKAEPLLWEAKAVREKVLGKEHPDYAASLNGLAVLYQNKGDYAKAEPLYLESKEIRAKALGKEHPDYAATLTNLAILYKNMGNYANAEPLFLEAKEIRAKVVGKEHPDYSNSLHNFALFYQSTNRIPESAALFLEMNELDRRLIETSATYSSESQMLAYLHKFDIRLAEFYSFSQAHSSPELSGEGFDNALFYNGFLLENAHRLIRSVAEADSLTRETFELWQGCRRRLANEYAKPIAKRRYVPEVEAEAEGYEKTLTRNLTTFGDAYHAPRWQEVRDRLREGEAAVEFIHYQFYSPKPTDSVFYSALVLRPGDKAPLFVPLFEEREIAPLLENAKGGNVRGINALYSPGGQKSLYGLVWKPLEESLKGVETVYCSPSGLLHRLNLSAIPTDDEQTISDRRQLVLLGSTRQLVVPNFTKAAENSAYIVGGVRYDMDSTAMANNTKIYEDTSFTTRGTPALNDLPFNIDSTNRGDSWRYLPGSATEATEISKVLNSANFAVQLDTGYFATEEKFKTLGSEQPSPRTILVSTHGFFFPDPKDRNEERGMRDGEPVFKMSEHPMMRSGLVLAGANEAWASGKAPENREDGILTAYEISQMNLSGTELVVLSACETGLGDIEGNEGVYGLQRAFKIAGAKYLMMSLWKVNDQSTRELMTDFYQQWLTNGLTIPEAFRAAQQNMKNKYPDAPYHWAGFVLVE